MKKASEAFSNGSGEFLRGSTSPSHPRFKNQGVRVSRLWACELDCLLGSVLACFVGKLLLEKAYRPYLATARHLALMSEDCLGFRV